MKRPNNDMNKTMYKILLGYTLGIPNMPRLYYSLGV